jgi:hypothetical protein
MRWAPRRTRCASTGKSGGEMMQRISRGEAEAVFESGFTGGLPGQGAPDDSDHRVAIKPFSEGVSHYCVEDWHAILLGLNVDEEHEGVTSAEEAEKLFAPTVMTFVLDGKPFKTIRLPVKPLLRDPPEKVFALVQGRVVGPDELAVGSHTLTVTVEHDPTHPKVQVFKRKFFIDAAGTGACT